MSFDQLTRIALLGVERLDPHVVGAGGPPVPAPPDPATPLSLLQAQVARTPVEHHLLSHAALTGLHEQIGRLASRDPRADTHPAPAENQPHVSLPAHTLLRRLLDGDTPQLLPEWLELATVHGRIVHPDALPALLTLGAQKPELRQGITPVLGHRGVWLAHQFPPGSWVQGSTTPEASLWETGSPESRLAFLQHTRHTQPDRARELLTQTWNQESPDDRARWIATFETGLSSNDEPFLESALDDRRKEVRRAAVRMLARLPASRWAGRMRERVSSLLTWVPGTPGGLLGLRQAQPARLDVILPTVCDKPMQRDGIDPKPLSGFGEKAGWLIQMIELVPLDHWTQRWQASPTEVVSASQGTEWAKELLEGWTRGAILQSHPDWADALFASAVAEQRAPILPPLLALLPPSQREARVGSLLSQPDPSFLRPFLTPLLSRCDHAWSAPFSRTILVFLKLETQRPGADWTFRDLFPSLATRLPETVLPEVFSCWPTDSPTWDFWSKGVDGFLAAVQRRLEIHQAFRDEPAQAIPCP